MTVEVFFSRPGNSTEIKDRIINEIKYAKNRLLAAQYSFTDEQIQKVFVENKNVVDKALILHKKCENLKGINKYIILGADQSGDPIYSKMHHKFLIIDDTVWVGSFNLTPTASSKNWENILRITDNTIVEKFVKEFKEIFVFGLSIRLNIDGQHADLNSLFKKFEPYKNLTCLQCNEEIDDVLSHFNPEIYMEYTEKYHISLTQYWTEWSGEVYDEDTPKLIDQTPKIINYSKTFHSCSRDDEYEKIPCSSCQKLLFKSKLGRLHVLKTIQENIIRDNEIIEPKQPIINEVESYLCKECMYDYLIIQ